MAQHGLSGHLQERGGVNIFVPLSPLNQKVYRFSRLNIVSLDTYKNYLTQKVDPFSWLSMVSLEPARTS